MDKTTEPNKFPSLYDYYKNQYPKDVEVFCKACRYYDGGNRAMVDDLEHLKRTGHPLLDKKHFVYFMVIHTALLMFVYKRYRGKYDEFKQKNGGMVFEFGLTNTFIYPWEILQRWNVSFDKELFESCLGWVIFRLNENYNLCNIVPNVFLGGFIEDPDLNKDTTPYGRAWKKMCVDAWVSIRVD